MNERMVVIPIPNIYPGASAALGATFAYYTTPVDLTIVSVVAAGNVDDTGLTLDINDDGSGVITGIDCADASAPGTWKASGYGGTNDPVRIAAGSVISFDANSAANATVIVGLIFALIGENMQ